MRNDRFSVQVETRGPKLVMTFDEVKERPSDLTFEVVKEKPHADADISRKLDKILDALEREIKGDRPTPSRALKQLSQRSWRNTRVTHGGRELTRPRKRPAWTMQP